MRVVVCLALDGDDPFQLAPARLHDPPWISGGIRILHELAVAAAAAGYPSEVRGDFHGGVLASLSAAAGVEVGTPTEPRTATADDIVCVPDGIRDPMFFIRVALMVSTPVYLALAPPGLFGWSFVPGWRFVDALDVDPESVGLPEHCVAIDALGFRVWSNAPTTGGAFVAAGVPATVLHYGWPTQFPAEPPKSIDVVTVADNRWAPITREALRGFDGTWRELHTTNEALLTELGQGQIFVHCARIEGDSRLAVEARMMGACCVGLASNRFAVGFDDASGGALVEQPGEVVPVVRRLLGDATELASRQQRARASARSITGWAEYVERVGRAIHDIETDRDRRDARWRQVGSELGGREEALRLAVAELEATNAALRSRRSTSAADAINRLIGRTGAR